MNLTRRIFLSWGADIITTVVGFIGTIYFARTLGPAPLGVFALAISIIKWLRISDLGITQAAIKRISEGETEDEVIVATLVLQTTLTVLAVGGISFFKEQLNAYVGGEFAGFIAVLFALNYLASGTVSQILRGYQRVHVSNGLYAFERTARVLFQVAFIILGLEVTGLMLGMTASLAFMTLIGCGYILWNINVNISIPDVETFKSLYDYSKYSVLGVVKSQAFTWTDMLVLGFFVQKSVIGVYNVSWTLAMAFVILGNAMQKNLFPEVSNLLADGRRDRAKDLLSESMLYAGLFPIAGIVGALLLGRPVLSIYGSEFTAGKHVLVVLIGVALLRAYEGQIHAVIDGVDRPDLTFKLNALFTVSNLVLNLAFIPLYGGFGAAVATCLATSLSVVLGWRMTRSLVSSAFPVAGVFTQIVAAAAMGAVVFWAKEMLSTVDLLQLFLLVTLGAVTYFTVILVLSEDIRSKALSIVTVVSH